MPEMRVGCTSFIFLAVYTSCVQNLRKASNSALRVVLPDAHHVNGLSENPPVGAIKWVFYLKQENQNHHVVE